LGRAPRRCCHGTTLLRLFTGLNTTTQRAVSMRYWLMKSEPDVFGIEHLAKAPKQTVSWGGVRNYQVRNLLRDEIKKDDLAFFYHSSCPEPGVVGVMRVTRDAHPDATQFDLKDEYFDPKSTRA